jgi:hypothetical protein
VSNCVHKECVCLSLYIGAVAGRAGQVCLRGTYAAVVAVDTVTNIVTNMVGKIRGGVDTSGNSSCDLGSTAMKASTVGITALRVCLLGIASSVSLLGV